MRSKLKIRDLSASFGEGETVHPVFRSVSFEAQGGSVLGIFGPNGCGKSTLLRTLASELLEAGPGVDFYSEDQIERLPKLGLVPQQYANSFFGWASLLTNLRITMPHFFAEWGNNREKIEFTLEAMELDLDLRRRPRECSGGMRQQAAIVRAFSDSPDILLADEPFSALDVQVARQVRRAFRKIVEDRGIVALVVLHDLEDILEICDRVLVIPGRPFSTISVTPFVAKLVENQHRQSNDAAGDLASFTEIAERLFASRTENASG